MPHYLTKHGVSPEPDLVAHIRATGFTPPQPDEETKDAVYLALTGEIPGPAPTTAAATAGFRRPGTRRAGTSSAGGAVRPRPPGCSRSSSEG